MPHSFFILYRLFLRVDNVLFRMYDIRIYHQFGSDEVVREICGMEADYEEIKSVGPTLGTPPLLPPSSAQARACENLEIGSADWLQKLEQPNDLSPLTNPNFVYQAMQSMGERSFQPSGKTKGKAWPGLGKRVEVMSLSGGTEGVEGGMKEMNI